MRQLPLTGRTIVVTRAREQARDFGDRLGEAGANVLYCAAIQIADPEDLEPFRDAVRRIDAFEWIVLTSVNGVARLFDEVERSGVGPGKLARARFAAVGPATAAAIEARGFRVDVIPAEYTGAALPAAMRAGLRPGSRILISRAAGGTPVLAAGLIAAGAEVVDVESYRSVPDLGDLELVRSALDSQGVDLLTFTSPRAVSYFIEAVQRPLNHVPIAAIGPITASRVRASGLPVAIEAAEHSVAGLVSAIVTWFASRSSLI